MKFAEPRPFADPEAAARKLVEIANATETAHREDQRADAVSAEGDPGRIQGWARARHRKWLAGAARERYFCTVHASRTDPVCSGVFGRSPTWR